MIDSSPDPRAGSPASRPPVSPPPTSRAAAPPPPAGRPAAAPGSRLAEAAGQGEGLYDDLFSKPSEGAAASTKAAEIRSQITTSAAAPRSPTTLEETGLTLMYVSELLLKHLYLHGNLLGVQLARQVHLPFQIVDEMLRYLKDERCIEVASGELIGPASYRFNLTDLGRNRAREAFEECRYVGPAPVPLEAYVDQCKKQAVKGIRCSPEDLRIAFQNLIIRDGLLEELGPAVCSGKSIFLYGPPGNGKTMIAKGLGNFLNHRGGEIHVPYAIIAENSIVTVFDPTVHTPTDELDPLDDQTAALAQPGGIAQSLNTQTPDLRWRRVRRPVVMTGGELTLDMLDLRYNKASNFYTAPLHIKANCGVFLIDDFGRQIVSPRDLLNRWILPLEEHMDFLTLATGKKFVVPFEQLTLFSTNLDPRELVDEAFLRRIRHKIKITSPERSLYTEIFKLNCDMRKIPFRESAVDYLYRTYYDQGKPPRASDPRDLLEIAQSICRFRNEQVELTEELLGEATAKFFCKL